LKQKMTEPAFIIKTNAAGVDVYHANPKYEPVDEDDEEAPLAGPPPVPPLMGPPPVPPLGDPLWEGMPAFEQEKKEPFAMIKFRFETEKDLQAFAALIGQKLTGKTKSAWHPHKPHRRGGPQSFWISNAS
jgi:hypothetical protein